MKEDPLVIHLETIDAINYDDIILHMPIEVGNEFDMTFYSFSSKESNKKYHHF